MGWSEAALPPSRLRPHFVKTTVRVMAIRMVDWRCSGGHTDWLTTMRRVGVVPPVQIAA